MTADVKIDRKSVEELARRLRIYSIWDCPPASEATRTMFALLDAKEAAEAALESQAEHVAVVKPLEWRQSGAETPFGNYIVTCEEHDDRLVWFILFGGKVRYSLGEYVTEEAAKAAAQSDYERRILSAITISSADEARSEERERIKELESKLKQATAFIEDFAGYKFEVLRAPNARHPADQEDDATPLPMVDAYQEDARDVLAAIMENEDE